MKRISLFLLVLFCGLMMAGSMAESTAFSEDLGPYTVQSCAVVGNSLWMLADGPDGMVLLSLDEQSSMVQKRASLPDMITSQGGISLIIDGECLKLLSLSDGILYRMNIEHDPVWLEPELSFGNHDDFLYLDENGEKYVMTPSDVVVYPNVIYCLFDKWEFGRQMLTLLQIDRSSGMIEKVNVDSVVSISPYKDQQLLLLKRSNSEVVDLMIYNASTNEVKPLCLQLGTGIGKIRYLPSKDWPVWLDGRRIKAYTSDGKVQQVGYCPSPYYDTFELMNNQVVCLAGKSISLSEVSPEFDEEHVLTIYGNGDLNSAVELLRERHPDLRLYWQNDTEDDMALESMINKILSNDESIDIMVLTIDRSPFIPMKEKGYCLDLSDVSEIATAVAAMNPVVTQAVIDENKVYAVPIEMLSWGWYINRDVMEAMGLTLEDIPTSIEGLCAFIDEWNSTWVDEYPNYMPVEDWNDIRGKMLSTMITTYQSVYEASDKPLDFSSDMFARLITAYEGMHTDQIECLASDQEDRKGLLVSEQQIVGNFNVLGASEFQFLPMRLTEEQNSFVVNAQLKVLLINPRSQHQDMALELAEYAIEVMSPQQKHCLFTNATEPVVNPQYEELMAEYTAQEEKFILAMQTAEGLNQLTLEEEYTLLQLKKQSLSRYIISPEEIALYQNEILPYMNISTLDSQLRLAENETTPLSQCIQRYLGGAISSQEMITSLNRILYMITMENR